MPPSYDAGGSRSSLYYARLSRFEGFDVPRRGLVETRRRQRPRQEEGRIPRKGASRREPTMATFIISPHFRLQEWVAEEKRYFAQEEIGRASCRERQEIRSGAGRGR